MADGEVKIDTKLDTAGLNEGLKNLKVKLNNLGTETTKAAKKTETLNTQLSNTKQKADKAGDAVNKAGKNVQKTSTQTQKLSTILNEVSGSAGGFADKMQKIAGTGGPYVAAAVAAIGATKKIGEAMRDCTETYKVQERAELALATAARNNPYIDAEAVAALKNYAGELQKISDIGDETSIQLMAQLVSTGRTQEEIEKIMSAAADYAAATQTDIKTAVETLNSTYSGVTGTLGKQIGDLKDLTAEELENGKAVDIVADKYKGMASALADTATQAKNAKGDYQEALGELFKPTVNAWDKWWGGFFEAGTARIKALKEMFDNLSRTLSFGGIRRSVDEGVEAVAAIYRSRSTGAEKTGAALQTTEYLEWLLNELNFRGTLNSDETTAKIYIQDELRRRNAEERRRAEADAAALASSTGTGVTAAAKTADDYARESNRALERELNRLEVEAKAKGTTASAQDKYNVILKNYVALLADTEGKIEEGYPVEEHRRQQLEDAKRALDEETDAQERLNAAMAATQAVLKTMQDMQIVPTTNNELELQIENYRQIREQLAGLTEEQIEAAQAGNYTIYTKEQLLENLAKNEIELEKQKVEEKTVSDKTYFDEYAEQQKQLLELKKALDESEVLSEEEKEKQKAEIDKKYAQNKAALWNEVMQQINGYTQEAARIAQEAGTLMLQNVQTETDLELAQLAEKYNKGEMAETAYYDKQNEIRRKAAREEYKIKLFEWTASVLAATANIAEGVSKTIAQGGAAGLLTGALVSAAGAVQIASIIASKPTPPAFASGGIIGGAHGASMGGDNTYIHARTGEMVLNANQQRSLWDMISGQDSRAQPGLNLTVNNTQANRVDTHLRQENGALYLDILDKHINKGFTDGTYDAGYAAMHTRQEGVRLL